MDYFESFPYLVGLFIHLGISRLWPPPFPVTPPNSLVLSTVALNSYISAFNTSTGSSTLEFTFKLDLYLISVGIDFCLLHEILQVQFQCDIVVLIFQHIGVPRNSSILLTTLLIGCKELRQEVAKILPSCTNISSNGEGIFI